jgi:hypothetical protein
MKETHSFHYQVFNRRKIRKPQILVVFEVLPTLCVDNIENKL